MESVRPSGDGAHFAVGAFRARVRQPSNVKVKLTKRRLYENYLLNPNALAAVVNATDRFRDTPVTVTEIEEFIATEVHQWRIEKSREHIRRRGQPPADPADPFIDSIHGARLLEHFFTTLSETRVAYQKTTHSVELTTWLAENAPEDLAEIADLITDVLDSPQAKLAQASAP